MIPVYLLLWSRRFRQPRRLLDYLQFLKMQLFSDVMVEKVINKVNQEALLDGHSKPIWTAHSMLGVPFSSHKVDQICIHL
jgi:hypothetical protein